MDSLTWCRKTRVAKICGQSSITAEKVQQVVGERTRGEKNQACRVGEQAETSGDLWVCRVLALTFIEHSMVTRPHYLWLTGMNRTLLLDMSIKFQTLAVIHTDVDTDDIKPEHWIIEGDKKRHQQLTWWKEYLARYNCSVASGKLILVQI